MTMHCEVGMLQISVYDSPEPGVLPGDMLEGNQGVVLLGPSIGVNSFLECGDNDLVRKQV